MLDSRPHMDSWHAKARTLERFLADLIVEEMSRLRPGEASLPPPPWSNDLSIDESGLGLDSLERLTIASVVTEALHLHQSGIENSLISRSVFGDWLDIARAGLARYDAHLTFRTSGSNGRPKCCRHTRADLEQEATHLAGLLTGCRRVISAVPANHIYGFLFTVLLPAQLHCHSVLDVRHLTPQSLQHVLQPGDLLVSHPAHWALLAKHVEAFPANVVGVTSTAPCPDELARCLQERGLARLLQVFGSSETGGIGWRDAPDEPYRLMPFWERELADETTLTRRASDGTRRRLEPGDRLAWHDDICFTIDGRSDEAVQVAGTNVYPGHIARALMQHPQVESASVRLMMPHEGNRLKAYIVALAGTDTQTLPRALTHWVNARLSVAERPKSFTIGSNIPRNACGKLADWPLRAEVRSSCEPKDGL